MLRNFGLVWQAQNWLHHRFTAAGQFLLAASLMAGIFGLNTRQGLAYQIFGFGSAALLLALLLSARWLQAAPRHLRFSRSLPAHASVGAPTHYHLHVENLAPHALSAWSIIEALHDPRPNQAQFDHALEPGALQRNRFDRAVGYYRWAWLLHMNRITHIKELSLPHLAAGQNIDLLHSFTPYARGNLVFTGLWLTRTDPLGLCRTLHFIELPGNLQVLPAVLSLPAQPLPRARHAQHQFATASSGDGEEFVGLRPYRQGDNLRNMHWKSLARNGQAVVREYQTEYLTRFALLLDTVQAPAGQAFEDAITLAASLVVSMQRNENLLDFIYMDATCHCVSCGPGHLQPEALLRILAGLQASPQDLLPSLYATLAGQRGELSACVCVLLSWDETRAAFLAQLQTLGLPLQIWLIHAQPPQPCPPGLHVLQPGQIDADLIAMLQRNVGLA